MLINKKVSSFLVYDTEPVLRALEKINGNQSRIVFVVDEAGRLLGSFSDGDFRRWLTSTPSFDLRTEVGALANTKVRSCKSDAPSRAIESSFTKGIDLIPLIDDHGRLISIAMAGESGITIGRHQISESSPSYIIAEIGNNHNGDIKLAKHLVDLAVDAGADCVKFQMRDMASLYKGGAGQDASADLGAQYTLDLLSRFQLSTKDLLEVFDYCKTLGLTPLCTPWDIKSLQVLEDYGMEAYKVASADFTNHELLAALAATGKPLFCSTGMSTESEIKHTVAFLREKGAQFVVLHCNSTYPTPFKDVNLAYLKRLKSITGGVVGYSGHERGIAIPTAATALGAKVIEKHFTVDKSMEGNDHKVSLLPGEFKEMVRMIREVEEATGSSAERAITQGELINRETLAKSLVVNQALQKGQIIEQRMLEVKSPGQGLQPMYVEKLIGMRTKRDMSPGDYFYESDLLEESVEPRTYQFGRPFGIPVRYHDYVKLRPKSNFDFVEFHLSYQDLDADVGLLFPEEQPIGFAVHSPELFSGDHIMDLAAEDDDYRAHSIDELQRVCSITRDLKKSFPKTEKPIIVINAGGFSTHAFMASADRAAMYSRIAQALQSIDDTGVELVIQTMPPFPWHFGGQSYHNLFVDAREIAAFCSTHGYRICYDVSHSMMACNYYKWDLHEFTKTVGPYVAHLHVVDALGVDGEGVQIGRGDVDFHQLSEDLNRHAPNAQFIPEVWQGHKNGGEGFWYALDFLERHL